MPGSSTNVQLVGKLEPTAALGPIVPGQIADLAVYKDFAYLNSWIEETCTKGGVYVADIRNPRKPKGGHLHPGPGRQLPRRGRDEGDLNATQPSNDYHSVFMWEDDGKVYLVGTDNEEFHDVDIFDITNPRAPKAVAEYDLLESFPQISQAATFPGCRRSSTTTWW